MNKQKILERKLKEDPQLKELTDEQKNEERKKLKKILQKIKAKNRNQELKSVKISGEGKLFYVNLEKTIKDCKNMVDFLITTIGVKPENSVIMANGEDYNEVIQEIWDWCG